MSSRSVVWLNASSRPSSSSLRLSGDADLRPVGQAPRQHQPLARLPGFFEHAESVLQVRQRRAYCHLPATVQPAQVRILDGVGDGLLLRGSLRRSANGKLALLDRAARCCAGWLRPGDRCAACAGRSPDRAARRAPRPAPPPMNCCRCRRIIHCCRSRRRCGRGRWCRAGGASGFRRPAPGATPGASSGPRSTSPRILRRRRSPPAGWLFHGAAPSGLMMAFNPPHGNVP